MTKASKNNALREFDEDEARQLAFEIIGSAFEIFAEVWLKPSEGERFRVDAVARCPVKGYLIGLEFKRSFLTMSEFSNALRQAIDYRSASIDDNRLGLSNGQRLNCCLVFPDWDGLHEDGPEFYRKEALGMRMLAQHFRVGVLSRTQIKGSDSFVIGTSGVWHSRSGWTHVAKGILEGKRRHGSRSKRFDQTISH